VDLSVAHGSAIPIEERGADEVTGYGAERWAPPGVAVRNPAFDITPADLVSALITEAGVLRPPLAEALRAVMAGASAR
jgi:methylthioribose-1-phosphate isomerase